jgi:hypothetical protein
MAEVELRDVVWRDMASSHGGSLSTNLEEVDITSVICSPKWLKGKELQLDFHGQAVLCLLGSGTYTYDHYWPGPRTTGDCMNPFQQKSQNPGQQAAASLFGCSSVVVLGCLAVVGVVMIGGCLIFGLIGLMAPTGVNQPQVDRRPPGAANLQPEETRPTPAPDLILEDWSFRVEGGFVKVAGEVTNNSGRSLSDVTAVVVFRSEDDGFIKTSDALIAYNPILPNQKSPFEVLDTANPAMKSASVTFKELLGGTISAMSRKEFQRLSAPDPVPPPTPDPVPSPKTESTDNPGSNPPDRRTKWVNESYHTIVSFKKGKEWAEANDKTGAIQNTYVETGRTADYVELFCAANKLRVRYFDKKAEFTKDGSKWEWVANGQWE